MKVCRILGRNIRDSFKGVIRNFSLSLASISCITITLIVVSISIILSYNVNSFAENVEKDVTIVAFMKNDITDEEKDDVLERIKEINGIDSITYQSKTDIAAEMMASSEDLKNILSQYDESTSPLQPTYQVKVKNIEEIGKIALKIKKIKGVDIVKYGKITIGMVIALIIVTAFLISNTIKITIFSRKREIEIMRLVGASNINIKIPFIFEGLFLGVLGSVIPIIITTYGYTALYKKFSGQLFSPFIKLIKPTPFIYEISLTLIIIGVLVGMYGSLKAVRKHLKI